MRWTYLRISWKCNKNISCVYEFSFLFKLMYVISCNASLFSKINKWYDSGIFICSMRSFSYIIKFKKMLNLLSEIHLVVVGINCRQIYLWINFPSIKNNIITQFLLDRIIKLSKWKIVDKANWKRKWHTIISDWVWTIINYFFAWFLFINYFTTSFYIIKRSDN